MEVQYFHSFLLFEFCNWLSENFFGKKIILVLYTEDFSLKMKFFRKIWATENKGLRWKYFDDLCLITANLAYNVFLVLADDFREL